MGQKRPGYGKISDRKRYDNNQGKNQKVKISYKQTERYNRLYFTAGSVLNGSFFLQKKLFLEQIKNI